MSYMYVPHTSPNKANLHTIYRSVNETDFALYSHHSWPYNCYAAQVLVCLKIGVRSSIRAWSSAEDRTIDSPIYKAVSV